MTNRSIDNFDWTDERIALLKKLHARGDSFRLIAQTLYGPTRNAVIGKAKRLGLTMRERRQPLTSTPRPKRKPSIRRNGMGYVQLKSADVPDVVPEKVEPAIAVPAPAEFLGITFPKLNLDHCRYPRGGDDGQPILFCGQPRLQDSPYCARCHAVCHNGYGRGWAA